MTVQCREHTCSHRCHFYNSRLRVSVQRTCKMFVYCYNPFKKRGHQTRKKLEEQKQTLTDDLAAAVNALHFQLKAGMKICQSCRSELSKAISDPNRGEAAEARQQKRAKEIARQRILAKKKKKGKKASSTAFAANGYATNRTATST